MKYIFNCQKMQRSLKIIFIQFKNFNSPHFEQEICYQIQLFPYLVWSHSGVSEVDFWEICR